MAGVGGRSRISERAGHGIYAAVLPHVRILAQGYKHSKAATAETSPAFPPPALSAL
jgi:hypothetical protein